MIHHSEIHLETEGHTDVRDITGALAAEVEASGIAIGQLLVFVPGSTAGITTVEFEPGLVRDIGEFFESLLPEAADYHHHATWGDDNGASHVRAALLKPSLTIPIASGKLCLGTWQQVVLVDFDTRPRRRGLIVQISGEEKAGSSARGPSAGR